MKGLFAPDDRLKLITPKRKKVRSDRLLGACVDVITNVLSSLADCASACHHTCACCVL